MVKSGALFLVFSFSLWAHAGSDCSILLSTPNSRRVLYSSRSNGEVVEVRGAPKAARIHATHEGEVFRHYMTDPGTIELIREEKALRAGVLPYVVNEPGVKKEYYIDLTGAFITKPGFEPHQVGLGRNPRMDYVDFTLSQGTPVIQLEPGIFLLPGKPIFQKWIQDAFDAWEKGGSKEYPAEHVAIFRQIQAVRGEPELFVPIQILSYRKNGETK